MFSTLAPNVRQYLLITANYWAFTLTDGALRMLVVLYFHQLGYSPLNIALLFVFYELFGVITNLLGGWLGARLGLNQTMNMGLGLQILALLMLTSSTLSIAWVMVAQALSGIAKDLNKMSAKSAIKLLIPANASGTLYTWIARLTGSKNTLKGLGFFIGGLLLVWLGFQVAVATMAAVLGLVWIVSLTRLQRDLGKAKRQPKFTQILSKSSAINRLSLARLFLFAARDVWFVVALPVYFSTTLNWSHSTIGTFMASWVIAYGLLQTQAPRLTRRYGLPDAGLAVLCVASLTLVPALIAIALNQALPLATTLIIGLFIFGFLFAINSSVHSFLIVQYADADTVSMDVGFYYMANAMGRLIGTVLSGWVFQAYGLQACLMVSTVCLLLATLASALLAKHQSNAPLT